MTREQRAGVAVDRLVPVGVLDVVQGAVSVEDLDRAVRLAELVDAVRQGECGEIAGRRLVAYRRTRG